jgi:hexosaminidase
VLSLAFFSHNLKKQRSRRDPLAALFFAVTLIPAPAHLTLGQGEMPIKQDFRVSLSGNADSRIAAATGQLLAHLAKRTGMLFSPTAQSSGFETSKLVVECASPGEPIQQLSEDESYKLTITADRAVLSAPNPLGIIRGLATFEQLVFPASNASKSNFSVPAITIEDSPRFPWRGLHIDVSRHWMPVDLIKRNLDAMAAVKLNVFHWHLSDNQGFRIESKRYPRLQGLGSDSLFYTQTEVTSVIAYARDRGIRVVPEFDVPGHSTAWLVGYPELAAGKGPFEIGRTWGIFDPVIDPTTDYTYDFLDAFIGEMAALFPDAYFHIGGDEVNGRQWDESPRITEFKKDRGMLAKTGTPTKKDLKLSDEKLQAYFNERILAIVKKHGKKMMGWDEILAPELPKDIVIQSWQGQKSLADAVQQGFQGILSSGYYLDHMDTSAMHYAIDPLVDPKTKQPLNLTQGQSARILGGEVCMWSEYVSAENVDSRIWPRTAAVAERFWSPQSVNDPKDMYRRLDVVSEQLTWYGVTHRSSFAPMLERLAAGQPMEPLRTLADVVTPVGLGGRSRARKYTQDTPLNRLVDAARPESQTARHFATEIDAADWPAVRAQLSLWRDNGPLPQNALLQEIAPVAASLKQTAALGLEALDFITTKKHPPQAWTTHANEILTDAKKPKAELNLAIVEPVRKLVEAANQ